SAPFDYLRAHDLEHALELLDQHGDAAKLIAGGQSLVPMMAMRLARPSVLVDIYRLAGLAKIEPQRDRVLVGAAVRQKQLLESEPATAALPLVAAALPWVGHPPTRSRGTVGGSVAHADPSAELPLALLVLQGTVVAQSRRKGLRRIAATDFFVDLMTTALAADECLVATEWPAHAAPRTGTAFEETAIRKGDFALASAACQIALDGQGKIASLSLGVGGVGSTPRVFPELTVGQAPSEENIRALASDLAGELDPPGDVHADASFRRHLAKVLASRVIAQAARRAGGQ
ncbi:MAG: FAD binding domain-containing protein, partial [Quisquiliibacterium sp.]